jgi:hypothetical protein
MPIIKKLKIKFLHFSIKIPENKTLYRTEYSVRLMNNKDVTQEESSMFPSNFWRLILNFSVLIFQMYFFSNGSTAPWGPRPPQFSRLHNHTFRHTTVGRTPLDEGPARRRDVYMTTHNTHKRQTSMPPAVFEPTILVSERPQTHFLDRTATGIGPHMYTVTKFVMKRQVADIKEKRSMNA